MKPAILLKSLFLIIAIVVLSLLTIATTRAQTDVAGNELWQDTNEPATRAEQRQIVPQQYRTVALDFAAMQVVLATVPQEWSDDALNKQVVMALPLPDGTFGRFSIVDSPIMEAELAVKFPQIKTYLGQGVDDLTATVRFDVTPQGFHAAIFSAESTVYIDPYSTADTTHYISYDTRNFQSTQPFSEAELEQQFTAQSPRAVATAVGTMLYQYRLAVAATGEYTAYHGGTVVAGQAAIVTAINRVTGIYERELAIRFVLVANNDQLVYTDAGSDPYTNGNPNTLLTENQANIDTLIGSANYDVGHVFSTGGGGLAALGVICNNGNKARGETGRSAPIGDPFYVDYVAHELGHQFAGSHTFNGNANACNGNRTSSSAYEPGSGSTIQAYAGICGAQNLQSNSDDYFHTRSFDQMVAHTRSGGGSTCATQIATGNAAPVPDAGTGGFTIPANTPFALTGSATDPDGDSLTYNWEQYDLGEAGAPTGAIPPFFRSWPASVSPTRTFPRLSDLLNNTTVIGENLPTTSGTVHFRMTARDNKAGGSGVDYDTLSFMVSADAGPFLITAPNTALTWNGGGNESVTWHVANTASAPVNCANVTISLSTDGGNSFPTTLAATVPNDGLQVVSVPNMASTMARVKVACSDNIFFDISDSNFTIIDDGDGFALSSQPLAQEICLADSADYALTVQKFGSFNSNVALSAPSAPGVSAFTPASGLPPFSSTLTISNAPVGNYNFTAIGTAGADTNQVVLDLLVSEPPAVSALSTPTDAASDVTLHPTFIWQNSNASSYLLEVATDTAFTNVAISATVAITSYTVTSGLYPDTTYYWRVIANNLCGSVESTVFSFATIATSFACGDTEDFENGIPVDWTVITSKGTGWQTTAGTFCGSGNLNLYENYAGTGFAACVDSDADGGQVNTFLCTPALNLSGLITAELGFKINYQVYSAPGGEDKFEVLVSSVAPTGTYGAALFAKTNDYPSSSVEKVLNSGSAEIVSLSSYLGQTTAYVCFHYGGNYDWYAHLDDVSLTCENAPPTAVDMQLAEQIQGGEETKQGAIALLALLLATLSLGLGLVKQRSNY